MTFLNYFRQFSHFSEFCKRYKHCFLVFCLLASLAIQCIASALNQGQTTDETFYSGSGYPIVRYNNYEFLFEHPPLIIQLGALPLLLLQPEFPITTPLYVPGTDRIDLSRNGALFLYKMGNNPKLILFLERLPIILLTVLLGIGIYLWGQQLWGKRAGLLSLALYTFDPNIIAHGSLYTTDMGITVFYFFSIYALKYFFDAPTERRIILLGLICGAAFMSKISGLILLPIILLLFLIYYFTKQSSVSIHSPSISFKKYIFTIAIFLIANALGEKQAMVIFGPFLIFGIYFCGRDFAWIKKSRVQRFLFRGLVLGGAIACIVSAWFLKKKYGVTVASALTVGISVLIGFTAAFSKRSPTDNRIRLLEYFFSVWILAALVIVIGYTDFIYKFYRFIGFGNYMKPLGIVFSHSTGGHNICVEGSFVTCDWKYFPAVLAIKTPLLTLALAIIGFFCFLFSTHSALIKFIIYLPLVFFMAAAMQNNIHIGLRHILPIYPFLFLLAGYVGSLIAHINPLWARFPLTVFLLILLFLSTARTITMGPDYLAYFNELIGSPEQGVRLTADSNLNWGQDNTLLSKFILQKKISPIKIFTETMNADVYDYYRLPWKPASELDLVDPGPGFYALGIGVYTNLQKNPGSWFRNRKPLYFIGNTFFIFQVNS